MKPPLLQATVPCPQCGETLTAIGYPEYMDRGDGVFDLQLEVTGGNIYDHVREKHGVEE